MNAGKHLFIIAVCAAFLAAGPGEAYPLSGKVKNTPEDIEYIRTVGDVREFLLKSNGMRILLLEDHTSPVATVMMTYLAGAVDEEPGKSGVAHVLEHMMFKGTPEFNRAKGSQPARILEQMGAMMNATTAMDRTNYFEMIPSGGLNLALKIEADRMRNLLLDPEEFDREKSVVQNELERYYDSSLVKLHNAVRRAAFTSHPYGMPVIGHRDEVENMKVEDLRAFYERYYWPDNVLLAVIGDFDTQEILEQIKDAFGSIAPSKGAVARKTFTEPAQKETRRVLVEEGTGPRAVMISHKIPPMLHPDSAALAVLGSVLYHGQTSRLYQSLVEKGKAAGVSSGSEEMTDHGLYTTYVVLTEEASPEEIEKEILSSYDAIAQNGIPPEEVERARNQILADMAYGRDGSYAMASDLSEAIAFGDWTHYIEFRSHIESVTPQDVQRVVKEYFVPEKMTAGYFVPKSATGENFAHAQDVAASQPHSHGMGESGMDLPPYQINLHVGDSERKSFVDQITVRQIGPARVLMLQTKVQDVVSVSGSFQGAGAVYGENPLVAELTATLLDQGTKGREPFEIAALLDDRGASISYHPDALGLQFQVHSLSKDAGFVLGLAAEQLRNPLFEAKDFENAKKRKQVTIEQYRNETFQRGSNRLLRELYPQNHLHARYSYDDQLKFLKELSLEDIKAFYDSHYGSQELTLVVVGDFDPADIEKSIESAWSGWEPRHPVKDYLKKGEVRQFSEPVLEHVEGKTKFDVFYGTPIHVNRHHPDYLNLYTANSILGGNFTARLSREIRDARGLTYGIRSHLFGIEKETEGAWIVHLMINPPVLKEGLRETEKQLELFHEKGVTERELDERKTTLLGQYLVGLATTGGLSETILMVEEMGLGLTYLDEYPEKVESLTLNGVNQAVKNYMDPSRMLLVVSGHQKTQTAGNDSSSETEGQ